MVIMIKKEIYYDLNVRLVYGMRAIGKGHRAAEVLFGVLKLHAPPAKYSKYERFISHGTKDLCLESMKAAVEEAVAANNGIRDLCVGINGSWQKRGHVSNNGILSVTSVDTGKVIDICVMSKHCRCPDKSQDIHLGSCKANYQGTSGGMEVHGAVEVFKRSLSRYNVKYTDYLGEGDSKAYSAVVESKPYGEEEIISKIECVGHVQKRMGCRLRRMKTDYKKKNWQMGKV